jgi:hypothetical protein
MPILHIHDARRDPRAQEIGERRGHRRARLAAAADHDALDLSQGIGSAAGVQDVAFEAQMGAHCGVWVYSAQRRFEHGGDVDAETGGLGHGDLGESANQQISESANGGL